MEPDVILVVGANSQDACVLAEILANTEEKLILTSLDLNNSVPFHKNFFPGNKIVKAKEYSWQFFLKIFSDFKIKQVYIFGSLSIVYDPGTSKDEYYKSTIGLVESLTKALLISKKIDSVMIFHSSSVEMFGKNLVLQQTESTRLNPQSPYAEGKALAHQHFQDLREKGICQSINGIMYNHESKYRKEYFVTQKICIAVAQISLGLRNVIPLGNLRTYRDWSYANDLISAVRFGMNSKLSGDYILASGVTHSLEDWIDAAFKSISVSNWRNYVEFDKKFMREDEEYIPNANVSKAQRVLNLTSTLSFEDLVGHMVAHKIKELRSQNAN